MNTERFEKLKWRVWGSYCKDNTIDEVRYITIALIKQSAWIELGDVSRDEHHDGHQWDCSVAYLCINETASVLDISTGFSAGLGRLKLKFHPCSLFRFETLTTIDYCSCLPNRTRSYATTVD